MQVRSGALLEAILAKDGRWMGVGGCSPASSPPGRLDMSPKPQRPMAGTRSAVSLFFTPSLPSFPNKGFLGSPANKLLPFESLSQGLIPGSPNLRQVDSWEVCLGRLHVPPLPTRPSLSTTTVVSAVFLKAPFEFSLERERPTQDGNHRAA